MEADRLGDDARRPFVGRVQENGSGPMATGVGRGGLPVGDAAQRRAGAVGLVAAEEDVERLGELFDHLGRRGVEVRHIAADVAKDEPVVIVALSPALESAAEGSAALRGLVDGSAPNVLPVRLGEQVELLRDVSHIRLDRGVEGAAERLAILIEAGPADVVAWNRIALTARDWAEAGRPTADLLSGADIDAAFRLLAGTIAGIDRAASLQVRELAVASRKRARRRSTGITAVAVVVAALLATAAVVAISEGRSARTAESEATSAANRSEAARLNGIAVDLIDDDPDLPWLIAGEALKLHASTTVVEAALWLSSAAVPHTTFDLRGDPALLSASRDFVAVAYAGANGFDVLAVDDGTVVASRPDLTAIDDIAITADGSHVVTVDAGGRLRVVGVHTGDDEVVDADLVAARAVEPLGDHGVLVLEQDALRVIDPDEPDVRTTVLPAGAEVLDVAVSGNHAVVLRSDGVSDVELATGGRVGTFPMDIAEGSSIVATDTAVVVGDGSQLRAIERESIAAGGGPDSYGEPEGFDLMQAAVATWNGSVVVGDATGHITLVRPPHFIGRRAFPAHRGAVTAVAPAGPDAMISVGADARMRVWGPLPTAAHLNARPVNLDRFRRTGFEESYRNMVVAGRGEKQATVSLVDLDESFVIDRESLALEDSGSTGRLFDAARPTTVTGRVFTVLRTTSQLLVADPRAGAWDQFALPAPVPLNGFLTGTSTDARWFALAGESAVMVSDVDGNWDLTPFSRDISPVAVHVDAAGVATVLDAEGVVHASSGDVRGEPMEGRPISAAAPFGDDRFVAVTSDGDLLTLGGGAPEPVLIRNLAEGRRPYAIEVSPDRSTLALINADGTDVVAVSDGRLLTVLPPSTELPLSVVTDVAFDDDARGGVLVRENGDVERFRVPTTDEVAAYISAHQPRPVNGDDRAAMAGEERTP